MIKKIFTLSMFLCATLFAFAVSKAEGDALYEKEQYEEAAKVYETLLHDNGMSAEVYYNLGNCYYKMDLIPQAILNYERAYLLNPGDGDIRANLALARGKTIDKVVPPSEMFFVTWWRAITHSMSIGKWILLAVLSFVLLLVGVGLYMFSSPLLVRKIGIHGAMVLLVVVIVANCAAATQFDSLVDSRAAIVTAPSVSVKSSPSDRSTDLFLIHEGSKVEILDASMGEWMEVKFEEGKQGWIPVSAAEKI